ncbi:MAG TPA: dihydrofolate reductase family protein [Spirochaetia bacterium]|nr:dihydrofolate reductase family protein [Spirochaetia bacterium]
MRDVIYLMNLSLDGFIEGPDGKFEWTHPDEEIHRFHNRTADEMGAFLYGRRLYETMAVWQTWGDDASLPDYVREFARVWRSKPKIVFSTTLTAVGEGCRLVRGEVGAEVSRLKRESGGDLSVGGPGLASALARLDLIDEYRLVIYPILVGGGKSYYPPLAGPVPLRLLETRTFARGAVYLRYRRA